MANHRSGLLWGSVGTSSHGRSFDHIWLLVDDGLCVCVCWWAASKSRTGCLSFFSLSFSHLKFSFQFVWEWEKNLSTHSTGQPFAQH